MIRFLLKRIKEQPTTIQFTNRSGGVFTIPLGQPFKEDKSKQTTFKEWNKKWLKK